MQVSTSSLRTPSILELGETSVTPQLESCLGPEETCCYCMDPVAGGGYTCVDGNTCDNGAMFPPCRDAPGKCGNQVGASRSIEMVKQNISSLSDIESITVYLSAASNTRSVTMHQIAQVTLVPDHQVLFVSRANDNLLFTDSSFSINGYRFLLNNVTIDDLDSPAPLAWPKGHGGVHCETVCVPPVGCALHCKGGVHF